MRQVAICSDNIENITTDIISVHTIQLEDIPIKVALIETPDPVFNPESEQHRFKVLVKKIAFSGNYRDKRLALHSNYLTKQQEDKNKNAVFVGFGSDFVGKVITVGVDVKELKPGDRVINDGSFPAKGFPSTKEYKGVYIGLPTNTASKELEIFHYKKVLKIPEEMPDEIAAAFGVGGITSYSMMRKLNLKKGEKILVTAAKSNTALFSINALKNYDVDVFALSTSDKFADKLKLIGVKNLIIYDPQQVDFRSNLDMHTAINSNGTAEGFDAVIDPFFDIYLSKVLPVMAAGGRYTSCGRYHQYSYYLDNPVKYSGKDALSIFKIVMFENKQIIGNCLGLRSDLELAIADHIAGKFPVIIDSIHEGKNIPDFFYRSYSAPDRFGKVVYKFE